ncbi:MAG: 4-alpha-glucanotransferase [Acidobacteriia bacterium]|nr:4-alpha-glucanotransferase [Terriglobia bacterium]
MTGATRRAGVLLHPTSLPGRWGVGDLGPGADAFLSWISAAGQSVWQVLPLCAIGPSHSPYVGLSTFAGNPWLVSPERLVDEGLLDPAALESAPGFPDGHTAFVRALPYKASLLKGAWRQFRRRGSAELRRDLEAFRGSPDQAGWLEDWALFMALRMRHRGRPWTEWPYDLRKRSAGALRRARCDLADEIAYQEFLQFLFFRQWHRIKSEANRRGIQVMGDLPIYVAHDSADVWANPRFFDLGPDGLPVSVAGVPPDYFSETGQLWGNPLYRWDRLAEDGYAWWVERMRSNLRLADLIRLDHFRAFAAYWAIPAEEPTAVKGRWIPGPGRALFDAIGSALGKLPMVAEDLGLITPDVHELRLALGLPGMRVLQFAFDGSDNEHLPARNPEDSVVYTGTHDNDTTRGWFDSLDEGLRRVVVECVGTREGSIEWDMIRAAYGSAARLAVIPMQDVLGLGTEARMNTPGRPEDNWTWRAAAGSFEEAPAERLARLAGEYGRRPGGKLAD